MVEAANAASFSTSNSSAIATANATATALAADNGTCSSYPAQGYTLAVESSIAANETEAAAAGIAAGFAQGCCVGSATTVAVLDYIAQYGCNNVVGTDLLRKSQSSHLGSSNSSVTFKPFIKHVPNAACSPSNVESPAFSEPRRQLICSLKLCPAAHCL